jgi:hypothetical protein
MRWLVIAALLPGVALADDWKTLTGPEITEALTARVVTYAGDHRQDFMADGTTLYDDSRGAWRVEGDQYCSQWPPSDRWDCYWVSLNGLEVYFIAKDGTITEGRYADLR